MAKVPFEGKSLMTKNIESFYFDAVVACEVRRELVLKNPSRPNGPRNSFDLSCARGPNSIRKTLPSH